MGTVWWQAKTALITGGGGAIGAASAVRLAAEGADVVVADRAADRVETTVSAVEALGRRAVGVVADLTEAGAVEGAVATTIDELGSVDILVNALGEHLPSPPRSRRPTRRAGTRCTASTSSTSYGRARPCCRG